MKSLLLTVNRNTAVGTRRANGFPTLETAHLGRCRFDAMNEFDQDNLPRGFARAKTPIRQTASERGSTPNTALEVTASRAPIDVYPIVWTSEVWF